MARITKAEAAGAAARYAEALTRAGIITEAEADQVCIAQPYGQVYYLVRYDKAAHAYHHDLPGFTGSGSAGSLSLRELVGRVLHSTGLVYDLRSTAAPWVAA
jgi:hypothetical protein